MLTIEGLVLGYGGEPVLDGVDLSVDAGRIVALVGPSGSGKSSILRTVMELQETAGRPDHAGCRSR
jgi:ABC-type branched-subunit amino acid transport system ATPase component